jgi:hypothetical protein
MIAAAPIITQLKAAGFKHVEGVLEFAGLKAAPAHAIALFVVPHVEAARDNETNGIHDQRVATQFRVIILRKIPVRADAEASRQLEQDERAVINALAGWRHPDATGPTNYAGGSLLAADGWGVTWASNFRANWRLRKGNS